MINYGYSKIFTHFLLLMILVSKWELRPDLSGNPFFLRGEKPWQKRLGTEGGNWRPNKKINVEKRNFTGEPRVTKINES